MVKLNYIYLNYLYKFWQPLACLCKIHINITTTLVQIIIFYTSYRMATIPFKGLSPYKTDKSIPPNEDYLYQK